LHLLEGDADLPCEIGLAHSPIGAKDSNFGSDHHIKWIGRSGQHHQSSVLANITRHLSLPTKFATTIGIG
jgi:hypothetical protein